MGKFKDWVRCAYHNRLTFASILGVPASLGFITYGVLEKDVNAFAAGSILFPVSGLGLIVTSGGKDTLKKYISTKKRLERGNGIPRCLNRSNIYYCDRRGIELAVSDYQSQE